MVKVGLTLGGQHTMHYTDVSQNCTLATDTVLLTNVTPNEFNF